MLLVDGERIHALTELDIFAEPQNAEGREGREIDCSLKTGGMDAGLSGQVVVEGLAQPLPKFAERRDVVLARRLRPR